MIFKKLFLKRQLTQAQIFTRINKFLESNDEGSLEIFKKESDQQPDTTDMPELETEESVAQRKNQQGKGLKILTPNQMLSRLPISLAQLNTGNNSEKLKNEITQLLHSFYRSKKLTKQLYKSLFDII